MENCLASNAETIIPNAGFRYISNSEICLSGISNVYTLKRRDDYNSVYASAANAPGGLAIYVKSNESGLRPKSSAP